MHVTKRFHAEELEMNMTPMIDVVFQLLIFFLVVSEIASYRIEDLVLPNADEAKPEATDRRRLVISIDTHGKVWIYGRVQTIQQVDQYLHFEREDAKVARGDKTDQPVLILADRYVEWRVVQDVVEKINELKFWKLAFGAKKE